MTTRGEGDGQGGSVTEERLFPPRPEAPGAPTAEVRDDDTDAGDAEADDAVEADDTTEADDAAAPDARRRPRLPRRTTSGRRAQRRQQRRRSSLARVAGFVALTLAVALAGIGTIELLRDDPTPPSDDVAPPSDTPPTDRQPTLVLATFDEAQPGARASLVVVLAYDHVDQQGTILLVPTSTVADVPGHGLLPVGEAFAFGRGPLLDATLDNLLGVDLDHVAAVSEQGWASLFTRVGGLTVDVPERLVDRQEDGAAELRFAAGEQYLDGPRLAELLVFQERSETELSRLTRVQLVLTGLLQVLHDDPEAVTALFEDGAPMLDTPADPATVRQLLTDLAAAQAEGRVDVRTLPVEPIGSGEVDTYRLDTERAQQLVAERFAGSVPTTASSAGRLLEIRNGNGEPGIGQHVAQLLLPAGFRVVLTGNADSFDHATTKIVIYRDTPEQLAIAREIRDVLGVGDISVSRVPQSVVDVTIVVGDDFHPAG